MSIFEIVLDGPGKNALSTAMMDSILARLDEAGDRTVLLSGKGDAFCAGLNLKELASLDADGMRRFVDKVEALMERLFHHPAPTVASVGGHAIAGGCILALCCDYRVMTDAGGARVGVNEVALGLVLPPKIFRIVRARVAPRSLHEVALRGALHAPSDGLRLGLVDELAQDAHAVAMERARELDALPRPAYVETKRLLRADVTEVPREAYELELRRSLPAWTDPALKARLLARLEKK